MSTDEYGGSRSNGLCAIERGAATVAFREVGFGCRAACQFLSACKGETRAARSIGANLYER